MVKIQHITSVLVHDLFHADKYHSAHGEGRHNLQNNNHPIHMVGLLGLSMPGGQVVLWYSILHYGMEIYT